MKKILSIAGSDSSGGAGIQADLKTISAHKMYGMTAITALTAQNTTGVYGIIPTPQDFVTKQIECIFDDITPDAVKIGMLPDLPVMKAVHDALTKYSPSNVVLDPVMVSTSGHKLMQNEALDYLKYELLPLANIITPNLSESEYLCGHEISSVEDMKSAAKEIYEISKTNILIKGGHLTADATDILFTGDEMLEFSLPRINNPNNHGTGCTLSSAIACNLASGFSVVESIRNAKNYLTGALMDMLDLGKGSGPVNHLYKL